LLGTCSVPNTGGWTNYTSLRCKLNNEAGTLDLCLVFKGAGAELMRLDWFRTDSSATLKKHEAENASLSAGCGINTNHANFSGSGFVDGFTTAGATTRFVLNAADAGDRNVTLRYSAGAGSQPMGLYVNGKKIRNIQLPATTDWETWSEKIENLPMEAGANNIDFKSENGEPVNLDYIIVPEKSAHDR
jgi:hypothetical protein